jgi:hypothetical protein
MTPREEFIDEGKLNMKYGDQKSHRFKVCNTCGKYDLNRLYNLADNEYWFCKSCALQVDIELSKKENNNVLG